MHMSQNQTERFGLHLWEPGDHFLREEFNENFTAVETAMAGRPEVVIGSYTGNGLASRTISLGFTPKCVILVNAEGRMSTGGTGYDIAGGVFFPGGKHTTCKVVAGGFTVSATSNSGLSTNSTDSNQSPYFYIAFR